MSRREKHPLQGLQDPKLEPQAPPTVRPVAEEVLFCPNDKEPLIRGIGNIAVCGSCDYLTVIRSDRPPLYLVHVDPGDDHDHLPPAA